MGKELLGLSAMCARSLGSLPYMARRRLLSVWQADLGSAKLPHLQHPRFIPTCIGSLHCKPQRAALRGKRHRNPVAWRQARAWPRKETLKASHVSGVFPTLEFLLHELCFSVSLPGAFQLSSDFNGIKNELAQWKSLSNERIQIGHITRAY